MQTEAIVACSVQLSIHQRAGKGELTKTDMENGINSVFLNVSAALLRINLVFV